MDFLGYEEEMWIVIGKGPVDTACCYDGFLPLWCDII